MNKTLLSAILLAAAGAMSVGAENRLVFESTDGTQHTFALTELTITVNAGKLHVTNSDGTATLDAAGLSKMYFSDDFSAVTDITADILSTPVTVYGLTGVKIATYASMQEACSLLTAGYYIMVSDGVTYKIHIK